MRQQIYCFAFTPEVSSTDAEESLHLSMFAVEGLLGEACVALDVRYHVRDRMLTVDASTKAGEAVAKVFTALATREFGRDAVTITRIVRPWPRSTSPT